MLDTTKLNQLKEINQNKKNVILSVNCVRCFEEL